MPHSSFHTTTPHGESHCDRIVRCHRAAAIAYRLYNINEFKKYSAKKFKAEQEAKQKAEYQKFLAERREKRLPSFLRLIS